MLPSPGCLQPPQHSCPYQGGMLQGQPQVGHPEVGQRLDIPGGQSCHANASKAARILQSSSIPLTLYPTTYLLVSCRAVYPFPPYHIPRELLPSVSGSYGEENEYTKHSQASSTAATPRLLYHCDPPTIVIPRLQISDLTLYPFWFNSGLILSGCKEM